MQLPQININGTQASDLLELYVEAKRALGYAVTALNAAAPHGRDYVHGATYQESTRIFYEAQREHTARILKVRQVLAEIETLAEHVI
jgi:hypothetical protein